MRYKCVRSADAKKYVVAIRENVENELTVTVRGTGAEVDEQFITDLRQRLSDIRTTTEGPLPKGSALGATFEATAAEIVHRTVPHDPALLADPEFWIWLAVVHFADLIEWRYGKTADLKNFGVGAAGENFIYRMWLRGELAQDESQKDRYALATRGDIDFWRSHLFRQGYANTRVFARALIKFQYPDSSPTNPTLKLAQIRELVKRLRRLRTNLVFEMLDDANSEMIIKREAASVAA